MDIEEIRKLLESHKDLDFVQRILEPEKYPVIDNPDGSVSTHLMSWSNIDGRNIVYPLIRNEGGELRKYDHGEAMLRALSSGEYLEFKTSEEADAFSREYKKVWERGR